MTNEELTKKVMEHEGILGKLGDKIGNAHKRIDDLSDEVKDLRDLTVAVTVVSDKVDVVVDKVESIDKRTKKLENEPAESFKYYKRLIIGCVITTMLGAIFGAILALIIK